MNPQELLEAAAEAARLGGRILRLRRHDLANMRVDAKAESDFVTNVDRESEAAVVAFLQQRFPGHRILAEEGGTSGAHHGEIEWIIDPLDGTTNYIHGVPSFAVSIAARCDREVIAAAVFDPLREEMFTAHAGGGAFVNGVRLRVTATAELKHCLLATGFPFRAKHLADSYLHMFRTFFGKARDLRRIGAASLDLAYVAAGRFDGFWEYQLNPWDFAAGVLLICEAGGLLSGFHPEEDFWKTGNILASNGKIHEQMRAVVCPA